MQLMWNNIFHMKQCACPCYSFYDLRKPEKQVERRKYFLCHSWKVAEPFCVLQFCFPPVSDPWGPEISWSRRQFALSYSAETGL